MATLILTEAQRTLLKAPLGELISGTPSECTSLLKAVVDREKPTRLILVGDTVARNAIQMGMKPDVVVIDNKEKRHRAIQFAFPAPHTFRVRNAAGTIESRAQLAVADAVRIGGSMVEVEGEEDLLALVAILSAPNGSLVVYGQPDQGIVLVRVSVDKKKEIDSIIEQMEKRD